MSHRMDFNERVVGWVDEHAGASGGTTVTKLDSAHWQRRLAELSEKHRVPGAALGILRVRDGRTPSGSRSRTAS